MAASSTAETNLVRVPARCKGRPIATRLARAGTCGAREGGAPGGRAGRRWPEGAQRARAAGCDATTARRRATGGSGSANTLPRSGTAKRSGRAAGERAERSKRSDSAAAHPSELVACERSEDESGGARQFCALDGVEGVRIAKRDGAKRSMSGAERSGGCEAGRSEAEYERSGAERGLS